MRVLTGWHDLISCCRLVHGISDVVTDLPFYFKLSIIKFTFYTSHCVHVSLNFKHNYHIISL